MRAVEPAGPIRVGGVRATRSAPTFGRAATVGLMRGATVGLMVSMRDPTFRLGVRIMLCARVSEGPKASNGSSAATNAQAGRATFTRQFERS